MQGSYIPAGGTPLLPPSYLTVYLGIYIIVLGILYIYFYTKRHPVLLWQKVKLLLVIAVILKASVVGSIGLLGGYWLIPTPGIRRITTTDKIEIVFDRPVKRGVLEKYISPDAAGVWVYENSIYTTHLYRKLVFYPTHNLRPDTTYKVKLSNIRNLVDISKPYNYEFEFRTAPTPNVLDVNFGEVIKVKLDKPNEGVSQFDFTFVPSIAHEVSLNDSKIEYTITPQNAFISGTQYNLKITKSDFILNLEDKSIVERTNPTLVYDVTFPKLVVRPIVANTEIKWEEVKKTTKLDVPAYLQKYTLSCEIASLRMALNFRGANVSEDDLIPQVGLDPTPHTGNTWGNPNVAFVGNIKGTQMKDGYGVHWAPIAKVARNYRNAEDFQGWNIGQLTKAISDGNPVVIWVYSHFGRKTTWNTPGGEKIDAVRDEHAVVAVGFVGPPDNPTEIIINDPLIGQVYWSRSSFNKKWEIFGRSGVAVY